MKKPTTGDTPVPPAEGLCPSAHPRVRGAPVEAEATSQRAREPPLSLARDRVGPVSGRAPPVELAARHLAHWTGLEPGLSAAPGAIRLPLLPSGPDGVHESPPRRAQLFASGPDQRYRDQPSGRNSTPHEADFGCRAPLAPRLARPRPSYGPCALMVNTRATNGGGGRAPLSVVQGGERFLAPLGMTGRGRGRSVGRTACALRSRHYPPSRAVRDFSLRSE